MALYVDFWIGLGLGIKRCAHWRAWPREVDDHSYAARSMKAIPNRMDGGRGADAGLPDSVAVVSSSE